MGRIGLGRTPALVLLLPDERDATDDHGERNGRTADNGRKNFGKAPSIGKEDRLGDEQNDSEA